MSRKYALHVMPSPAVITPMSRVSPVAEIFGRIADGIGLPATGTSPWSDAADTVLAFPFILEAPQTRIYKGFWLNGSNAGGNSDIAIYDESYNLLTSAGSIAGSGNDAPQIVTLGISPIILPPGVYYAGMSHSATTTNQVCRWSGYMSIWQLGGCWKFSDNPPISSATATPADLTNNGFPVFGLITRSVFDV